MGAVLVSDSGSKSGAIGEEEDLVMLERGAGVRRGKRESVQVGRGEMEKDQREKMRILWYITCDRWYEYTLNLYY